MKKIFFSILALFFMAGIANAQVKEDQGSTQIKKTQDHKKTYGAKKKPYSAKSKKTKKPNADSMNKAAMIDTTNPGGNFKSKVTKQVATPSGQEATGTGSTNASNPKNAGNSPDTTATE